MITLIRLLQTKFCNKPPCTYTLSTLPEMGLLGQGIYVFKFDKYYQLSFKPAELTYTPVNSI